MGRREGKKERRRVRRRRGMNGATDWSLNCGSVVNSP